MAIRACQSERAAGPNPTVRERSMKGKVILVTGANGGLGRYVTQAFLDAGATVVGVSRKIQQSDFNGPAFTALSAEISTAATAKSMVESVVARFHRLDVGVHTA